MEKRRYVISIFLVILVYLFLISFVSSLPLNCRTPPDVSKVGCYSSAGMTTSNNPFPNALNNKLSGSLTYSNQESSSNGGYCSSGYVGPLWFYWDGKLVHFSNPSTCDSARISDGFYYFSPNTYSSSAGFFPYPPWASRVQVPAPSLCETPTSTYTTNTFYSAPLCRYPVIGDGLIRCDENPNSFKYNGCEECDDRNTDYGDGCSSTGKIEGGYFCDYNGTQSVCDNQHVVNPSTYTCSSGNNNDCLDSTKILFKAYNSERTYIGLWNTSLNYPLEKNIVSFPIQYREHAAYSGYTPYFYGHYDTTYKFYEVSSMGYADGRPDSTSCASVGTSVSGMGYGYVFAVLNKSDLYNKKFYLKWQHYASTGVSPTPTFKVRLYDGSYDAASSSDFPTGSTLALKGYGELYEYYTGGYSGTTSVMELNNFFSDSILSKSTQEQVTFFIFYSDAWIGIPTSMGFRIYDFKIIDNSDPNKVASWNYGSMSAGPYYSSDCKDNYICCFYDYQRAYPRISKYNYSITINGQKDGYIHTSDSDSEFPYQFERALNYSKVGFWPALDFSNFNGEWHPATCTNPLAWIKNERFSLVSPRQTPEYNIPVCYADVKCTPRLSLCNPGDSLLSMMSLSVLKSGGLSGFGNSPYVVAMCCIREGLIDSDNDCIKDVNEGVLDSDGDGTLDKLDSDSDNDGLLDKIEDKDCDGVVDSGETNPKNGDSDSDGLTDGQEDVDKDGTFNEIGETDPLNPNSPQRIIFWATTSDPATKIPFSTNIIPNVVEGTTKIWIHASNFPLKATSISVDICETDLDANLQKVCDLLGTITLPILATGKGSYEWTISNLLAGIDGPITDDDVYANLDELYLRVATTPSIVNDNTIKLSFSTTPTTPSTPIEIITPYVPSKICGDYTTEVNCTSNPDNINKVTSDWQIVSSNTNCEKQIIGNGCEWEGVLNFKCNPVMAINYRSAPGKVCSITPPSYNCLYSEVSDGSCTSGDFINIGYQVVTGDPNFCKLDTRVLPCPEQVKVPIFGWFNFIISIFIIVFGYLFNGLSKNLFR